MTLNMNVRLSRLPGEGLTDFCAMAESDSIGSAEIMADDGLQTALVVFKMDQGSNPMSGLMRLKAGDYVMGAYVSQMSQLVRVNQTFLNNTANLAEEANLTAPNGDVVHFTFTFPEGYVYDEIAAVNPQSGE